MIAALIPARAGSKRVPGKNIKELGGIPLLVYSIRTALECPSIDAVYVSTEDAATINIASRVGANIITRPEALAQDASTDYDVVNHALTKMPEDVDLIVYLRPTTPFREVEVVQQAIETFRGGSYSSLRSVELLSENVYKCFCLNGFHYLCKIPYDFNDYPDTYKGNGYVDIVHPFSASPGLVREKQLWGDTIFGFLTEQVIEIDTPHEWRMAENEVLRQEKRQGFSGRPAMPPKGCHSC